MNLVLKNGKYLDTQKKEFVSGDIYIKDGLIVDKIDGDYEEIDVSGKYIVPGFIDGHIHLESSIIKPEDFAKMVCFHGTTALVTDPHEIANVCGINGIRWMMEQTKNLPIDVYFVVSSCVPATPFDESAYTISSEEIKKIFDWKDKRILGLAEVMNYPGVINNDPEVMKKIKYASEYGLVIDGHAPGLTGDGLRKYIEAGIMSDHECSTLSEAMEKLDVAEELSKKFYIMIREGTAAKNLAALSELMNNPKYYDKVMFATDDKHPEEINNEGHIDNIIRKAIALGIKPEIAYTVASYNASKYFGLNQIGSLEIGKEASMVILDDIYDCKISSVIKKGIILNEEIVSNYKNDVNNELDKLVRDSIHMKEISLADINISSAPVIELVPHEIITRYAGISNKIDVQNDIIKIVVIEPHKNTNHIGVAYLKGLGLKKGAIGTTVAHDSHYMILAGTNDDDIVMAANEIIKMHGGKIVCKDGKIVKEMPLPIANLMTDDDYNTVINNMRELKESVSVNEGIDPFMNLSFVSLAVIPDIRLLPGGVFDVNKWKFM